jgi:diacylglycerol kinase family enzyme
MDIKTREELASRAREVASSVDVLVVAGGDGSVSDVINAVDTSQVTIAYLPLGSGNALAHSLKYPLGITRAAIRIKEGPIREYDLILCSGRKKALLASIGIEGAVLRCRDRYFSRGFKGLAAYSRGFLDAYFRQHRPFSMEIDVDGRAFNMSDLLSVSIVKHPCYGYGLKLVPHARFDERKLHIFCAAGGLARTACIVLCSFTIGNRTGKFMDGCKAVARLEKPLFLQTDGDLAWEADNFTFEVLPKALKIKF